MKLPNIEFTMGVQPLGKPPIGMALSVANAKAMAARQEGRALIAEGAAAASFAEMIGTSVVGAAQIGAAYQDWQTQKATNDADLKVATDMTEFDARYRTQQFMPGSQVPENIDVQRTEIVNDPVLGSQEVERQVPMYEVLPQFRKDYRTNLVNEQAKTIPHPGKQRAWSTSQLIATEEMYGRDIVRAAGDMSKAEREKYQFQFEDAINKGQWGLAGEVVVKMPASPIQKRAMFTVLNKAKAKSVLDEILTQRQLPDMRKALEMVKIGEPSLTDSEEKGYATELRRAIAQEENAVETGTKVKFDFIIADARDYMSAIKSGQPVNPDSLSATLDSLNRIKDLDDRVPLVLRNYEIAMELSGQMAQFNSLPVIAQDALLEDLERKAKSPSDYTKLGILESARDRNEAQQQKDTLSFGADQRLYDLIRVDWAEMFKGGNFPEIASILFNRKEQAGAAAEQYGKFTGYLTNAEAVEWSTMLSKASPAERLEIIDSVERGLGGDSGLFYEQLGDTGLEIGSFVIAGQLSAQGARPQADTILKGDAILKSNPETLSRVKSEIILELPDYFRNLYQGNPERRGRVRDAVFSAYAAFAETHRNLDAYEEDYLERAIETVTGGILEYNDSNIESPYWGVTERAFGKWVKNLQPSYIDELGTPDNFTSNQVLKFVKDGTFKLRSKARGEYYIFDPDHNTVVMDSDTKEPFVFRYNSDLADIHLKNVQSAKTRAIMDAQNMASGMERRWESFDQAGQDVDLPGSQFMGQ